MAQQTRTGSINDDPTVLPATNAYGRDAFGFALPSDAELVGIEAVVERLAGSGTVSCTAGFEAEQSSNSGGVNFSIGADPVTVGGPTEDWGNTLNTLITRALLNSTTFYDLILFCYEGGGSTTTHQMRATSVTVYYTSAGGGGAARVSCAGVVG